MTKKTLREQTRCLMCKNKINEMDLGNEDYYQVKRGHSDVFVSFLCFDCFGTLEGDYV